MELKRVCASLAIVCICSIQLASADPDCKNLRDRSDEIEACCQLEPIIPQSEADDCSSVAADASHPHERMMCVLQCKLESLGVMNGKQFVPEKVLEYANRFEGDWKEKAVEIATMCNERLSQNKVQIDEKAEQQNCSPVGGILMMCLMKQTFETCPADKWQNTDFCNKLKSGECMKRRPHH